MTRLFHIVGEAEWSAAVGAQIYVPASLAEEGFVHCSYLNQVAATAARHFAGVPDLVVVEFDADQLDAPVVVEDTYGSGSAFPHVYGPIPTRAAVRVHQLNAFAPGNAGAEQGR